MKDLKGKRFGRLTAIERAFKVGNNWKWRCVCDCGNEAFVYVGSLTSGHTKSCGCYFNEVNSARHLKHGQAKTRLYHVWHGMLFRCENPKATEYSKYGGRGIKVCDEWNESFEAFEGWATHNGYDDSLTLDRIDVNGNYEPNNCRWITIFDQQSNKRNNVNLTFNGETHTVTEWARLLDVPYSALIQRVHYGWDAERTLTTPIRHHKRRAI